MRSAAKALLLACLWAALTPPALTAAHAQGDNVILISFDAMRADRLGKSGPQGPLTPNLDAAAARSYRFTNAVSQSAWTLPSMMSLFTSLYPHQHTVVNKFAVFTEDSRELARLPPQFVTLAEIFKRNGYDTAAFTGDAGVKGRFGFNAGFDVYFDAFTFGGFDRTFPLALGWIKRHQDRKFFIFVHGYDVHGQFSPKAGPAQRQEEFKDLRMKSIKGEDLLLDAEAAESWKTWYDAKVAAADERFGRFWEKLAGLPAARRTLVVIISDHGDQLYEHGGLDHGMTLYDEIIRVPLIIHDPRAAGARIDGQVRLIDVMPTLADRLGLKLDAGIKRQMQGVSLLPLMRGKTLSLDAFSETSFLLQTDKRSLRTSGGWKLIYDPDEQSTELYDLRHDPLETRNLATREAAISKDLKRRVLEWMDSPAPSRP
jgi:arylsulfatase A-like enzyme